MLGALREQFRPEFLNRIDEIVVFQRLGRDEIDRIVDFQLAAWRSDSPSATSRSR